MPTALISVSKQEGIEEFANDLVKMGWDIISFGETTKTLRAAGLTTTDISEISYSPPILSNGTAMLIPQILAGLMASEKDREELERRGWPWIDLCCVDFHPLRNLVNENSGVTAESVWETTDIGGPTLVRCAARGGRIIIAHEEDRSEVLGWIKASKADDEERIRKMVSEAEMIVGDYCFGSALCHSKQEDFTRWDPADHK